MGDQADASGPGEVGRDDESQPRVVHDPQIAARLQLDEIGVLRSTKRDDESLGVGRKIPAEQLHLSQACRCRRIAE